MAITDVTIAINDVIASTTSTSPDTCYTSSSGRTIIQSATVQNQSASSIAITFHILGSAESPTATNHCWTTTVAANETKIMDGLIGRRIPNGGTLRAYAGTTNVLTFSADGVAVV